MTITFDTLKLAQQLEASGFSREQAAGTAQALSENLSVNKDELVTNEKLLQELEPIKTDITIMKAELGMIEWMMGGTVFGIFLLVVKTFLV